ncbi:PEP-CTERM sorting domain-containing protein [Bythopirellula polymerisocia]|uniref:Uncharacterized protein n=1 Tax=Bythopirellula polymerisocia TaxID=2528003 RepID=A0A5C6CTA4_9BACT|nr:PEP-CTERM sorting domain-containing protein [Bythopirellula polymerisocia]TWU27618.1 hypothetical protein Pla144_23950 [Bythopirellula polymerisocia]
MNLTLTLISSIRSHLSWVRMYLITLILAWGTSPVALAAGFTKIADTSTAIPNGVGNFDGFDKPIISGSTVAFHGGAGIYVGPSTGGSLQVIVDLNDAIPAGIGNFTSIERPRSSSESIVAFRARGSNDQLGIYAVSMTDGTLSRIADQNTAIANGSGTFSGMSLESASGSTVAFSGGNVGNSQRGIYVGSTSGGPLTRVADRNTPIPGGVGVFERLGQPGVALHGNKVAWTGRGANSQVGIYIGDVTEGSIVRVADASFAIPDGIGTFRSFYFPYLSQSIVAFEGLGDNGQEGIYAAFAEGGMLTRVADLNTSVPLGNGNFSQLFFNGNPSVSVSGSMIAFQGLDSEGQTGIYAKSISEDVLTKIVATGDTLDGRSVSGLRFGIDSLDAGVLAFAASFTDGTSGVYTTSIVVPEPSSLILVAIGMVMFMRRRAKRTG